MDIKTISVSGFKGAIIGVRLPMCKSYDEADKKSDSTFYSDGTPQIIGPDDLRILKNLIKADEGGESGQPNSKYLRMIHVQAIFNAPTYYFAELDTYKTGTTRNSTSVMHKGMSKEFDLSDFDADPDAVEYMNPIINALNEVRQKFIDSKKDIKWFRVLRQILPAGYDYVSMMDLDYATLRNMYYWRCVRPHKLSEWSVIFKAWVESLPYAKELICDVKGEQNGK